MGSSAKEVKVRKKIEIIVAWRYGNEESITKDARLIFGGI